MKGILGAGLLAFASMAFAGDGKEKDIVRFYTNARVVLDEQGVPQQVRANEKLPPAVRDVVEQRVMQWRFEPARINGVAKAGVTHVLLEACAVPSSGGNMQVAMDYRSNGPAVAGNTVTVMPPRYPVSAVQMGHEGSFNVVMRVQPDGRASVERIDAISGSVKPFQKTLRDWVAAMRYVPEEVDGAPISTQISTLVDFGIGAASFKQLVREKREAEARSTQCQAAAGAVSDPLRPVVLDSPFRPRETG